MSRVPPLIVVSTIEGNVSAFEISGPSVRTLTMGNVQCNDDEAESFVQHAPLSSYVTQALAQSD